MPDAWIAALADVELEQASSPATFRRGQTYAASGAIQVLAEERGASPTIRARVQGSALYTTTLRIDDDELSGDCDCPNAQDVWFCKQGSPRFQCNK